MKRGLTLIELLLVLASASIVAALLFPILARPRETRCGPSCAANLKQLGLALTLYAQDAGGRLPPVALNSELLSRPSTQPYGWADALWPYTREMKILHCPRNPAPASRHATQAGFTDYFFNRNLSAGDASRIARPSTAVLLSEGNPPPGAPGHNISNARYALRGLPQRWAVDEDSPWHRHKETTPGGFLLFVDGHVRFWHVTPPLENPTFLFTFRPRAKYLQGHQ